MVNKLSNLPIGVGNFPKEWLDWFRDLQGFVQSGADGNDGADGSDNILGTAYIQDGSGASTTSIIPYDDTIPQNTEGAEALTLSYTPVSATSYIYVFTGAWIFPANSGAVGATALFKDSDVNALAVSAQFSSGGNHGAIRNIHYRELSGSTTARTYKIRYGSSSGTTYLNRNATSRRYGGVLNTFISIIEVNA